MIWARQPNFLQTTFNVSKSQLGSLILGYPNIIKTRICSITVYNVKSESTANKMVNTIFNDNDGIIIPSCGFPNPVVQELLSSRRFRSLTLCEPRNEVRASLKKYIQKHHPNADNINVRKENILGLSMDFSNEVAQGVCSDVIQQLSSSEPNGGSIKMYIPMLRRKHEPAFLTNLYSHCSMRVGLSAKYLINFYMILSDRQYQYIIARPGSPSFYKAVTVKLNTFFDFTKHMTIRTDHDLDLKNSKLKLYRERKFANQDSHLVSIRPKIELIESLSEDWLRAYSFFLAQVLYSRTKFIYEATRKLFNVSDQEFEALGIKPEMRTVDVSIGQYLELFRTLKDRPDYKTSIFHEAIDSNYKKKLE